MKELKQHPLVIVFYLDEDTMKIPEIINPFSEMVNQMLTDKETNALAFFIPTKGEERVECINPIVMKEADMEKIEKIIEDIKSAFLIDIPVENSDIIPDDKPCVCKGTGDCQCEN